MSQEIIFGLIGGLGLFVLGMKFFSESLQKIAGPRIRGILRSLIGNRFQGVAVGAGITCIVQSSSVTTVMLVGLINAGVVTLTQAVSVVMGANIGTTITGQIIAFKVSAYALPAIGIGVAMVLFSKTKRNQFYGNLLLSCGLIFLGLSTMSGVMKPLKDLPQVTEFFVLLSGKPFLLILLGLVVTMTIQSSSASMGLTMSMACAGLIDFTSALFLMLGGDIGTTITAWLATIGGSVATRRMACFHSFFNITGACYFYFLIKSGYYVQFIDFITPSAVTVDTIARHIANAHTLFNVINTGIFLSIMPWAIKFVTWAIPGKEIEVSSGVKYLQEGLLATPELAIESTKKELVEMGEIVRKTANMAIQGFLDRDKSQTPYVETQESSINHLQHDITYYITRIATQPLAQDLNQQVPLLIHSVNDLERIADHAVNITELTDKIVGDRIVFSQEAMKDMKLMFEKVDEMFIQALAMIAHDDADAADQVLLGEKMVNQMHQDYRDYHVKRLVQRQCKPGSALVFVDYLNNLEKIADHLTNIVQAARHGFIYDVSDHKQKDYD